ncbi:hypothetical protein [Nostoc sp.]|uniref:hypothetical protein n=1 Tax=Nostoc sp. TaxID=1180 RepID=UPI003FA55D78
MSCHFFLQNLVAFKCLVSSSQLDAIRHVGRYNQLNPEANRQQSQSLQNDRLKFRLQESNQTEYNSCDRNYYILLTLLANL